MVSHSNITSGAGGANYFMSAEKDLDAYYASEERGEWFGKGAEALGLTGEVEREAFVNVLEGKTPDGEQQIVGSKETGRKLNDDGEKRCGTDFTFGVDKSYSIVAEEYGDKELKAAILESVKATLQVAVEEGLIVYRPTEDKITRDVPVDKIVAAIYQHSLSRENDAHSHVHVGIINMCQTDKGEWKAIDVEGMVKNEYFLDQVFSAELAKRARELGYATEQGEHFSRIVGSNKELEEIKSKRTDQIKEQYEKNKENGVMVEATLKAQKEAACLGTRRDKSFMDPAELAERRRDEHTQLGTTPEAEQAKIAAAGEKQRQHVANNAPMTARECVLKSAESLTATEAVFSRVDLIIDALKLGNGTHTVDDIRPAVNNLVKERQLYALEGGRTKNAMTTPEIYNMERDYLKSVQAGIGTKEAVMTREEAQAALNRWDAANEKAGNQPLKAGQREAAAHILTSGDRYTLVQGYAGTGKTTMLKSLNDIVDSVKDRGFSLVGASYTGTAAGGLEAEAKIGSSTVHSLLDQVEKGKLTLNDKTIVVVDEASMMDIRLSDRLDKALEASGARAVMIGDTAQLQSVGAAPVFREMQRIYGDDKTAVMDEIVRQKDGTIAQQAVKEIAEKRAGMAFEVLDDNKLIHEIKSEKERIEAVAAAYRQGGIDGSIIVTSRNQDRQAINETVREARIEAGEIERGRGYIVREDARIDGTKKAFSSSYALGDVLVSMNGGAGLGKGQEGRVTAINSEANTLTVSVKVKGGGIEAREVNLAQVGEGVKVWRENYINIAKGDVLVCGNNDKKGIGVNNGERLMVESIDAKGNYRLTDGKDKTVTGNLSQYAYFGHGYAVTDYKSQGMSIKNVYIHDREGASYNSDYVKMSRGKEHIEYFTGDKDSLKKRGAIEQDKETTLGYRLKLEKAEKQEQKRQQEAARVHKKLKVAQPKAQAPQQPTREPAPAQTTRSQAKATAQEQPAQEPASRPPFMEAFRGQVREILDGAKQFFDKYRAPEKLKELKDFAKNAERQADQVKAPGLEKGQEANRHLTVGNLEAAPAPDRLPGIIDRMHKDGYEKLTLELRDGSKITLDVQRERSTNQAIDRTKAAGKEPGLQTAKEAGKLTAEMKKEVQKTPTPTNHTEAAKAFDRPARAGESKGSEITANGQAVPRTTEQAATKTTGTKTPETGRGIESTGSTRTASSTRSNSDQAQQRTQERAAETSRESEKTPTKGGRGMSR